MSNLFIHFLTILLAFPRCWIFLDVLFGFVRFLFREYDSNTSTSEIVVYTVPEISQERTGKEQGKGKKNRKNAQAELLVQFLFH